MDVDYEAILKLMAGFATLVVAIWGKPVERTKAALALAKVKMQGEKARAKAEEITLLTLLDRCKELEAKSDTLVANQADQKTTIDSQANQIAGLVRKVERVEANNEDLTDRLTSAKGRISTLEQQALADAATMRKQAETIAQHETTIASLRQQLDEARSQLDLVRAACPACHGRDGCPSLSAKPAAKKGRKPR